MAFIVLHTMLFLFFVCVWVCSGMKVSLFGGIQDEEEKNRKRKEEGVMVVSGVINVNKRIDTELAREIDKILHR